MNSARWSRRDLICGVLAPSYPPQRCHATCEQGRRVAARSRLTIESESELSKFQLEKGL